MNKIYMTKRGHDGKTVVCSEKTRARGKVKSLVLAVATVGAVFAGQAHAALATEESGAYATVVKDALISGSGGEGAVGSVTIGSDLQYVDAYGRQAKTEATAPLSIAIGLGATVKKVDGTPADSTNPTDPNFEQPLASVAIGASATANGYTSTAIGYRSSAIDSSSSAFGVQANAENFMATAIGAGSTASGFTTTAVGSNTEAVGRNSVAVGVARHSNGAVASGEQGILLGSADIEGLTAEQLQGAWYADGANPWSSFQGVDLSNPAQTTGESRASIVSGKNALGVGVAVKATGERSIAEGYYAKASSLDAIAIGSKSQALGINSISLGHNALANGGKSIAIGSSNDNDRGTTLANGTYSVAIGPSAQATGRGGIVIGENASANGTYRNLDTKEVFTGGSMGHNTVVIGREAQTFYDHDTVVGALAAVKKSPHASAGRTEALWDKQPATIMGFKATSSGEGGDTLIGAHASNDHRQTFPIGQSTAFGSRAFVYGDQGTALGADTSAVGNSSIAIGNDDFVLAKAKLTQSIPEITELGIDLKAVENLGDVAFANGVPDSMMKAAGEPTVLGTSGLNWNVRTAALGDASIAMGSSTQTGGDASIAMGFNALTRGSSSIAMGSLARANGTNAIAQGTATSAHAFDSIAIGRYATAGAAGDELATANATAIGSKSKATAIDSIAVGAEASVSGDQSIAIGKTSNVTGVQSIAVGVGHVVEANNAGAFGDPSYLTTTADGSYAIGNNNTVTTSNTFVLGSGINRGADMVTPGTGTVENSVYLGNESEVTAGSAVGTKVLGIDQVVGTTTTAGDTGAVTEAVVGTTTYGTFAGATAKGAVSVGASGAERRVQNVAAGEISATSTDAINGSQLYAMAEVIEEIKAAPDVDTDKSVRVAGSDLVTVTNTTGAADGITTMTDYTVSINKGSFGTTTDGSIVTGTDGVATVGDVMTAVNAGYWTANVGGAKLADVGFGDTLNFFDGNGTKAVIKNGGVAYDLNIKSSDNSIITAPSADGSVDLTVNSSMIPSTVVDAGKGVTVTPVTNGNTTTYTVAVDDTIADKQYVADEIAKIPVVTDTNTDKSVRVKSDSELLTVAGASGAADGITTMTDYTITLSDKVATKDFVTDEIAKIQLPVDTNTISEVAQGDGITVNAVTEGDKTTYTVALDDATKAQLAKEESVVAKAGETNIVVTQPRTNGTGGNEYEVSLAKDLTGIDGIGKDGSKFTFNGDSISAGNVNITDVKSPVNATDAANKQYVDDAIAKIPAVVDTNTDKSVRVKSDSNLLTVTSKAGEADGITQMTDYTISLSDKVATTDYVDGEIAKIPTIKAGDNIAVKQDTVDGKPVVVVSADKSTVSQGDGIAVTVTETPTANGAVNRDYKVSLDDATKGTLAKVEKGINTKAEDGKVTNHQLGDTISVVGDNKNITTATTNDGAISVKMADDIKVNSVSINNTGITMGGNGIHAGDMKVTGVAPGTLSPSSTDAVNGSQLYATNMQVAQNAQDIRNLGDQLGDMRDEYRAGIADAAAVAGLPEIHLAGKSMFAVAGSTFKGESALAVGYSRLSDNSMTKFKASGSVNTQGDVLGTVGIGWAW